MLGCRFADIACPSRPLPGMGLGRSIPGLTFMLNSFSKTLHVPLTSENNNEAGCRQELTVVYLYPSKSKLQFLHIKPFLQSSLKAHAISEK